MVPWRMLLAAAGAAIVVLSALTALPAARPGAGGDIAAFLADRDRRLGEDNLVDAFAGLRLEGKLRRVEWRNAELTVDIEVGSASADAGEAAWGDLRELVALAFKRTGSTERLLVRFVAGGGTAESWRALLLAADVRKQDRWLRDLDGLPDKSGLVYDPEWRSRLRLVFAGAWKEQIG